MKRSTFKHTFSLGAVTFPFSNREFINPFKVSLKIWTHNWMNLKIIKVNCNIFGFFIKAYHLKVADGIMQCPI